MKNEIYTCIGPIGSQQIPHKSFFSLKFILFTLCTNFAMKMSLVNTFECRAIMKEYWPGGGGDG